MIFVKKKKILLFSDGSALINKASFQILSKLKTTDRDHVTFSLNKKSKQILDSSKNSKSFKTKYLGF